MATARPRLQCSSQGGAGGVRWRFQQQVGPHFRGCGRLEVGASITADRGRNERGVNVSKRCGFNDVWLCWSFQANFMYSPVLYSPVL